MVFRTTTMLSQKLRAVALAAAMLVGLVVPPSPTTTVVVQAYPTGAGQCLVGQASVSGPHIPDTQGDNGTLAGIGIQLAVDGTVISDPSVPFALTPGIDHTVVLAATGQPLRGFLVAVSSSNDATLDLTSVITPDPATGQVASVCASPVAGITHFNNDDKTSVSGVLRVDTEADLLLDVTVVLQNSNGISSYGWNQFSASTAGADTPSPTSVATTASPTITPAPSTGPPVAGSTGPVTPPPTGASPVASPTVASPTVASPALGTPTLAPAGGGDAGEPSYEPTLAPGSETPKPSEPTSAPSRAERPPAPTSGGGREAPLHAAALASTIALAFFVWAIESVTAGWL